MDTNQIETTVDQRFEAFIIKAVDAFIEKHYPALAAKAEPIVAKAITEADPEIKALTVKLVALLEAEAVSLKDKAVAEAKKLVAEIEAKL